MEPFNAGDRAHMHRRWGVHPLTLFKQFSASQETRTPDCGKIQLSTNKNMIELGWDTMLLRKRVQLFASHVPPTQETVRDCVRLEGQNVQAYGAGRCVHGVGPEVLPRVVH